ncbi:MAG: hypothetical protein JJE09_04040 [Bacteroidia bacterium]|nr:hypothetical protein [Bacteroidia bacterium]
MKSIHRSFIAKCFFVTTAFFSSCSYNDFPVPIDCDTSDLTIKIDSKKDVTGCNSIDGSISVSAIGGQGPYDFSLNTGVYQTSGVFPNLGPGSYTMTAKDVYGCTSIKQVDIVSTSSNLNAVATTIPGTDCFSDNGSITVTASQGKPPYKFQFGSGSFGDISTFNNLKSGNYTVTIKDAENCPLLLNINVAQGSTSISYTNDIKTILDTSCNTSGCHNGSLGASRDWRTYATSKANAGIIKSRTVNKTMPPGTPLTQKQIDEISCWVDDGAPNN